MPVAWSLAPRPTRHPVIAAVVAALAVMGCLVPTGPAAATDPEVHADDERDMYIGTGGLVLPPGSTDDQVRRRVASCDDCRWKLTDPCAAEGGACLSVTHGCPRGRLLRAWSSTDGGRTWRPVGLPCIGPAGPVTVERVGREAHEEASAAVPSAAIGHQPGVGILPRLPVRFQARQVAPPPFPLTILGRHVSVSARPSWRWSFGDGASLVTDSPGARTSAGAIAHAYRQAGRFEVRLETVWHGTFTVDGVGPFPLQAIHQEATATLEVGRARAVLVS